MKKKLLVTIVAVVVLATVVVVLWTSARWKQLGAPPLQVQMPTAPEKTESAAASQPKTVQPATQAPAQAKSAPAKPRPKAGRKAPEADPLSILRENRGGGWTAGGSGISLGSGGGGVGRFGKGLGQPRFFREQSGGGAPIDSGISADAPAERHTADAEENRMRAQAEAYRKALREDDARREQLEAASQARQLAEQLQATTAQVSAAHGVHSGEPGSASMDAPIRGTPPPAERPGPPNLAGGGAPNQEPEKTGISASPNQGPATNLAIERYPNIEAPDTVAPGQEIAVQVSLTSEQIAPETKILSGQQNEGKLQLQMADNERQWTLTVNLTAPGMDITRGTNTAAITIDRDGDSTIAAFYLRAQSLPPAANGKRDTRIFATLWHDGAFLARIARPLTILNQGAQAASATPAPVAAPLPQSAASGVHPMLASTPQAQRSDVRLDPNMLPPDLTIVENRIGNTLRLLFWSSGAAAPVEADIANPDELHTWINSHFAQMSTLGRGFANRPVPSAADQIHAADYLNAFGADLYDRYAPQAFKNVFFDLLSKSPVGTPLTIQIFSDDPSLPWELMRPMPESKQRMEFLGATHFIARWPLSHRGSSRPPQLLAVERSVVVAPGYRGAQTLAAASQELATLKSIHGFTMAGGDYISMREIALHPPQGIVHFAGHGAVSDKNGVPSFAILLEDAEMDPATWQSLGSASTAAHPLFFFNACDVGESRQFMNDVDGWAPALLSNGASGYIGALWPVNDKTAALFASTFYAYLDKSLAAGHSLNVASLLANTRAHIFRETGDATALAYVFYGDPKLVLAAASAQE